MFEPKKLAEGIDVHDTMENIFVVVIYLPPFKLWKKKNRLQTFQLKNGSENTYIAAITTLMKAIPYLWNHQKKRSIIIKSYIFLLEKTKLQTHALFTITKK